MLFFGTAGPFTVTTPLVGADCGAAAAAAAGAFLARSNSAHDLGGAGFGGDALGVSSVTSVAAAGASSDFATSCFVDGGDLTDFCVVDVVLGAFADLMGMSGTAGFVVLRVCLEAGAC